MEYRLGNSKRIKSRGDTKPILCPKCGRTVSFGVFSNFERHLAANIKLFDLNTVYFLICPACAGIFSIDEEKGTAFKDGATDAVNTDDLIPLKGFKNEL